MHGPLQVAVDHPSFAGHFPHFPVLPGAILLDEALYAIEQARGIDLRQWQISSAKFLDIVRPNDRLFLEHDVTAPGMIHFTVRVANRTVASGKISSLRRS
jgi:3-hydroxyacyl-[acyl-carrier-protein] dehydratase